MQIVRRLFLLVACAGAPPLGAWALWYAAQYYLAYSHKFVAPETLHYAFLGELGIFYLAALMELRSRWSIPAEG